MSTENTLLNPSLLAPGLNKILFDMYGRRPEMFSTVYNVETSMRAYEETQRMAGLGPMDELGEGEGIDFDKGIEGENKRFTHKKFGRGFRVTEEMLEDDLYSHIRKLPASLGLSARQTLEVQAASHWNNAFTTSLGGDGQALCSAAHPLLDGGTESNLLATAADLSETSLKQAIIEGEDGTDDRGIPTVHNFIRLIHPKELKFVAKEILKTEKAVGSNENTINTMHEVMGNFEYKYLSDPDAWFLQVDIHDVTFFWRRKLRFANKTEFVTGDEMFKATMRFSFGHNEFRGIFGTPGA